MDLDDVVAANDHHGDAGGERLPNGLFAAAPHGLGDNPVFVGVLLLYRSQWYVLFCFHAYLKAKPLYHNQGRTIRTAGSPAP